MFCFSKRQFNRDQLTKIYEQMKTTSKDSSFHIITIKSDDDEKQIDIRTGLHTETTPNNLSTLDKSTLSE